MSYETHAAAIVPAAISNAINTMRVAMLRRLPASALRAEASHVEKGSIGLIEMQKPRWIPATAQKLHGARVESEQFAGGIRQKTPEIAVIASWLDTCQQMSVHHIA